MKRKQVVIMIDRVFPHTHKRKGSSTLFAVNLLAKRKIHTIRADEKGLWEQRVNEINEGHKLLSVREWTGRPYNSEQNEIKRYVQIGLQHVNMVYYSNDNTVLAWVDGKEIPVETLAQNDGLHTEDFVDYFFGKGEKDEDGMMAFEGVILHFTDFRY